MSVLKSTKEIRSMWEKLNEPWRKIPTHDDDGEVTYIKRCYIFSVYIYKNNLDEFIFELLGADGFLYYKVHLDSKNIEDAKDEGATLIREFMAIGFETVCGARPSARTQNFGRRLPFFKTLVVLFSSVLVS